MIDLLIVGIAGAAPAIVAYFVGLAVGKKNKPVPEYVHEHVWTLWERVDSDDTQERSCTVCGFVETDKPQDECPPHAWGKWEDGGSGTYQNGGKTVNCLLQQRYCTKCNVQTIQRITNRNDE